MRLSFTAPLSGGTCTVRDFLRHCGVSAQLIKDVKYTDEGFLLDGARVHTNASVKAGQTVSFALPDQPFTTVQPEDIPLEIVYEDMHCMVLNQPAGMAAHPTLGYKSGTLANAFCGLMRARGTPAPFRAVNRLDRNTSGLMLCALNTYSAAALSHAVHKEYIAVLEGVLPLGSGEINAPIARCAGSLITREVRADGKASLTQYTVLATGGGHSLVRCVPKTGRTHQLRVHFAHIGHPMAGDDLYKGHTDFIARHALHCESLRFAVGGQEQHTVAVPPPQDMQTLINTLL